MIKLVAQSSKSYKQQSRVSNTNIFDLKVRFQPPLYTNSMEWWEEIAEDFTSFTSQL